MLFEETVFQITIIWHLILVIYVFSQSIFTYIGNVPIKINTRNNSCINSFKTNTFLF